MSDKSVTFARPFRFSPDGVQVVEYAIGKADVSVRCAEVAKQAGVLKARVAQQTAAPAAPETAAATPPEAAEGAPPEAGGAPEIETAAP